MGNANSAENAEYQQQLYEWQLRQQKRQNIKQQKLQKELESVKKQLKSKSQKESTDLYYEDSLQEQPRSNTFIPLNGHNPTLVDRPMYSRENDHAKKAPPPIKPNKTVEKKKYTPYEILGVSTDSSSKEIKSAYRHLCMKHHPDKGGDERIFKKLTKAYQVMLERAKMKEDMKNHRDLQDGYRSYMDSEMDCSAPKMPNFSGKKFNAEKFNALFDQNRVKSAYDRGYDEGDDDSEVEDENPSMGGYNNNTFNSTFEDIKKKRMEKGEVVKYKEPEPLIGFGNLQYSELGVDEIDDFSSEIHDKMQFTDLKAAYGRKSKIEIGESDRPEYRNVEDLQNARGRISYEMSEEDLEKEERRKYEEEMAEQRRLERLRRQDNEWEKHHNKMKRLLVGGNGKMLLKN